MFLRNTNVKKKSTHNIVIYGSDYLNYMACQSLSSELVGGSHNSSFTTWSQYALDRFYDVYYCDNQYNLASKSMEFYKRYSKNIITLLFPANKEELIYLLENYNNDVSENSCFIALTKNSGIVEVPENNCRAEIISFPESKFDYLTFLKTIVNKHQENMHKIQVEENDANSILLANFAIGLTDQESIISLIPVEIAKIIAMHVDSFRSNERMNALFRNVEKRHPMQINEEGDKFENSVNNMSCRNK